MTGIPTFAAGLFLLAALPISIFVAYSDMSRMKIPNVAVVALIIAGYVTHRIAKNSPIRKLVPNWESWTSGNRFPMGFPLAMTLVFYLILVLRPL